MQRWAEDARAGASIPVSRRLVEEVRLALHLRASRCMSSAEQLTDALRGG